MRCVAPIELRTRPVPGVELLTGESLPLLAPLLGPLLDVSLANWWERKSDSSCKRVDGGVVENSMHIGTRSRTSAGRYSALPTRQQHGHLGGAE
jgi:hypothetical protein